MRTRTLYLEEMCKRLPDLTKKQVQRFLEMQTEAITEALKAKDGKAEVLIPGVVKISSVIRAATPERKMQNPFTKGELLVPARPESRKLRAKCTLSLRSEIGDVSIRRIE